VRATRPLKNDGTYPHKDLGEILVLAGDAGFVIEIGKFRGEMYYTVEFVDRAVVVAARSRDLVSLGAMPSAARH
jgi:nitrogen fixation protein NifZ